MSFYLFLTSALGHLLLDEANDDHQDRAADSATADVCEDTLYIHSASGRRRAHGWGSAPD